MMPSYLSRDFVLTREGIAYAVLADESEDGQWPAFPRYRKQGEKWLKLQGDTLKVWFESAPLNRLRHCPRRDCRLAFLSPEDIIAHYCPRARWQELRSHDKAGQVPLRLKSAFQTLTQVFDSHGIPSCHLGITGSLLIGASGPSSDLDLVVYDRDAFEQARDAWSHAMQTGVLQRLTAQQWQEAWKRRGTSLTLEEYCQHEDRKGVTVMAQGVKCDLGLVVPQPAPVPGVKLGRFRLITKVTEDYHAFERPARWTLDGDVSQLVANTATFVGQVKRHQWIEAIGMVERDANGYLRMVVGDSREAVSDRLVVLDKKPAAGVPSLERWNGSNVPIG